MGELLLACLQAVDGDASRVKKHVGQIEEILQAAELPAAEHRERLRDVFGDSQRLMRDLPVGRQRTALYQFLVRFLLSRAIDYDGYCLIEDILGGHLDRALLKAIDDRAADEPILKLLIADRLGARVPEVDLRELIELAAEPEVRPSHARILCGLLLKNMESAPRSDIRNALPLLSELGYLAPALSVREPDDLGYQVETLKNLLAAVFPGSPGRLPYRDTVAGGGKHAPTAALFLAVICLTPENVADVAASFTASLARSPDLSGDVREALAAKGLKVDVTPEPVRSGASEGPREYSPAPRTRGRPAPKENRRVFRRMLNPEANLFPDSPADD